MTPTASSARTKTIVAGIRDTTVRIPTPSVDRARVSVAAVSVIVALLRTYSVGVSSNSRSDATSSTVACAPSDSWGQLKPHRTKITGTSLTAPPSTSW